MTTSAYIDSTQTGGRFRRNRRFLRSFSARMILFLVIIIIAMFLLTALSYFNQLDRFLTAEHTKTLTRVGNNLYDYVSTEWTEDPRESSVSNMIKSQITFVAHSIQGYVWGVYPNGAVHQSTGYPQSMSLTQVDSKTGNFRLPDSVVGDHVPPEGYLYVGGNYLGLFNHTGVTWISYVRPIFNAQEEVVSVLQIHQPLSVASERNTIFLNSLLITILLSLLLGITVAIIASKRLVKPLRDLTDMAMRVSQGDLSVRAPLPKRFDPESELVTAADEVHMLKRTFNNMVEKLDHFNTDRRDMISSMSHDLRTPLTSIHGFVTGMLDGTIPRDRFEYYLGIVDKETHRLTDMVNQMHEMALLESQGLDYDFKPQDVQVLIGEVIDTLEPQIRDKQLTIQTNFLNPIYRGWLKPNDWRRGPWVIADAKQLQRVFTNLLANAIKFTPAHGIIALSTVRPVTGNLLVVNVEDSGIGLSESEFDLVFDRFYKSDRSRTGHNGSGLGLFITRQILAAHGQHITAGKSVLGGAKFSFTLQLTQERLWQKGD